MCAAIHPDTPVTRLLPAHATPEPVTALRGKAKAFSDLQAGIEGVQSAKDLSPEQQNLFNFLKLIVDIKYRHKYGQSLSLKSPRKPNELIAKTILENALKRRDYTGWFKRGGAEWVKGEYEPLIDNDLRDRVMVAMGWRKQRKNYSTKGAFYAYKGVPRCGTCSMNITAYTKPKVLATTGEMASYTFYVCTKRAR
jgi:hypothetical protein